MKFQVHLLVQVHQADYLTMKPAKLAIFESIEGGYNRKRRHSALGNRSPEQYQLYLQEMYLEEKRIAA